MTAINPKIILTKTQWDEIKYYTDKCPMEISGMGSVIIDAEGNFRIEKLALLEQEVSATATDIDPTAIAKLMGELRHTEGTLSFWWHSHVNMNAFFSGTDEETIIDHGSNGWCIALVINKKGEYKTSYCQKSPFLKIDDITMVIENPLDASEIARMDAEYLAKVKTRVYKQEPLLTGKCTNYKGEIIDDTWWNEYEGYEGFRGREEIQPVSNPKLMTKKEEKEFKLLHRQFYGRDPINQKELEEFFMDFNNIEEEKFYDAGTTKSNKTIGHTSTRSFGSRD